MAAENKDHWNSAAYQNSASFVPKLATEVMKWLDPKPDDVILDIGCGDGILDVQLGQVIAQGKGSLHGIDNSPKMIEAAQEKVKAAGLDKCTFEAFDSNDLINRPELQKGHFTKAFSNAAMHWILRPEATREQFIRGVRDSLAPGGTFAFEMGGLGNVCEMVTAIVGPVSRRIGWEKTKAVNPWFYADEAWAKEMLEEKVGGWKIERVERVWRPTDADVGGIEAWIRLMAAQFLEAVPEDQREECIREIVEPLEYVCAKPGGGFMISYVRLRVLARKL